MCNRDWCSNVKRKYDNGELTLADWILLFTALYTIVMSISSFATTVESYNKLKEIENDYGDQITHWDSPSLIDVELVDVGSNCPTGYVEGTAGEDRTTSNLLGDFPGTYVSSFFFSVSLQQFCVLLPQKAHC